jgi:PAS domain S-box-containing protein
MGVRCAGGTRGRKGKVRGEEWLDFESDVLTVHILTEDGFIAGTNRAFHDMFGTDETEVIGKHQAVLNNHSVAANLRLLQDIRREIDTTGSWRGVLTNRHAGGAEFTTRAHIYPMRYASVRRLVCFQS